MEGRQLRPNCAPGCRANCSDFLTDDQRQQIFNRYYEMADVHRQWSFLSLLIDRTGSKIRSIYDPPVYKRCATAKIRQRMRSANNSYYLQVDIGGEMIKVCQKMFLATFDINDAVVKTVLSKTNAAGELIDHDRRGGGRRLKK